MAETKPRRASKPTKGRQKKPAKRKPAAKRSKTTPERVVSTLRSRVRISDVGLRRIKATWEPYKEAGDLPQEIAGPIRLIVHLYPEQEATAKTGFIDVLLCRGRVYQRPATGPDGGEVLARPRLVWNVPKQIEEVFVTSGFSGTHVRVFADGSTMIFVNAWGGATFSWSSKTLRIGALGVESTVVS